MVTNEFIECSVCKTKFNLRIQMGNYDIPFTIHCPQCDTTVSGRVNLSEDNNIKLKNASSIDSPEDLMYCVELSSEFPTKKMFLRDLNNPDSLTPFLRGVDFIGNQNNAYNAIPCSIQFAEFLKNDWNDYYTNCELFWNKKNKFLYKRLNNQIEKKNIIQIPKVNNDIDALMAMHQLFYATSGVHYVIGNKALSEYTEIAEKLLLTSQHLPELLKICEIWHLEFDKIEKKAITLIDLFSQIYEQLIPIVALRISETYDNIDQNKYGIMTTNYEQLTDFYAKSYEWILDNSLLIIALNNVFVRGNYESSTKEKNLDFVRNLKSKYLRLDYLDLREPFGKPTDCLENTIRNSIQHFDSEMNYGSQVIHFTDKFKGRVKYKEISLMDFGVLCIENFSLINYILVLIYNLRKLELLIKKGMKPSCIPDYQNATTQKAIRGKKIGRNEPCPCGSGKKYKKCCGLL